MSIFYTRELRLGACGIAGHASAQEPRSALSIEIFDSGQRKIPFEGSVDSHHIAIVLTSSREAEPCSHARCKKLKDERHGQSCKEACREEGCQEAGGEEEEVRVSCLVPRNLVSRLLVASVVPAALLISVFSAAQAASITNRDDADRKVTIVEKEASKDHVLKKDEVLEGICERGCSILIDGDDVNPYVLEGTEVTTIEGGDLYAEGQELPAVPGSGPAGQPSKTQP